MKSMETGRQDGGSDKNHAPFSVGKTGNISRKFLTIILKIFDKNFERLHYCGTYKTEWDFLKDVLMQNGVPEEAILKEDQATYTYENAIYSRQVTDREYLDIKKAILCCKTCHARRALMYYKLLYPDTEFFVSSCCVDSIDKNTWIMTNDGIDEVMREITRIIKQFSLMLKKN